MEEQVELESTSQDHHGESVAGREQQLAPCDGGLAAWKLLIAAYVFEALLWGFPLSFGVFQNYYSRVPEFADDPFISVVGTTASGISYIGAPIVIPLVRRYAKYQRQMIYIGWPICILGLVAGSFATNLATLIFTQGIMYGIGFLIFYYPILSLVNEYWITRRGMAYGLLCSASGLSGTVMPFAIEALLEKYGFRTTLRVIAIGLVVLTGPLIPLLKGRTASSEQTTTPRIDWRFLRSTTFWIYSASNFVQGLGYFFPSIYLPSFATSIGMSTMQGALLLAILSIFQVFGQLGFGYISDRKVSLDFLVLISTIISGAAVLTLWGLAQSYVQLVFFASIYGFFGAGYVAMWARMSSSVTDEPTTAFTIFGLLCAGKGVGNVLTGPISAGLLKEMIKIKEYGIVKYQVIILFTGACMLMSGASILSKYVKRLPRFIS